MADVADVADVATIERISARNVEQIIEQLTNQIEGLERRVTDLAAALRVATVTVTSMLEGIAAATAARPLLGRPPVIDAACAADPAAGAQNVEVDVFGRTVVERVLPGSDPAVVWADLCTAVAGHAERQREA